MATIKNHILLSVIEESGDVNEIYPQSKAEDVLIERENTNIPAGVKTVQELANSMGASAFKSADKLVYIGRTENYTGDVTDSEINDKVISTDSTWSSEKIKTYINENDVEFSPLENTTEDIINKFFPIIPKVYNVNTTGYSSTSYPAGNPGNYIVEYFPFVGSANITEGDINSISRVTYAMQRWTLLKNSVNSTAPKVFTRYFVDGTWTSFISN